MSLTTPAWLAERLAEQRARAEARRDAWRADNPGWSPDDIEDVDWRPPACPMCDLTLDTRRMYEGRNEVDCSVCDVRWSMVGVTATDPRVIER